MQLADLVATFRSHLYLPDPSTIYIYLAAYLANRLFDTPTWLMSVAPSSAGKTELLMPLSGLSGCVKVDSISKPAELLTAARGPQGTGGLLRQVGDEGVWLWADFSLMLSMSWERRDFMMSLFRRLYDGEWGRQVGSEGGRELSWKGKLGILACCTPWVHTHRRANELLGERWLYWEPSLPSRAEMRGKAKQLSSSDRSELADAVSVFISELKLIRVQPSKQAKHMLQQAGDICSTARSGVSRDSYTREIDQPASVEQPWRLNEALERLYAGLRACALSQGDSLRLALKCALDGVQPLRRSLIRAALEEPVDLSASGKVVDDLKVARSVLWRTAEDLWHLGIFDRQAGGSTKPTLWTLTDSAWQDFLQIIKITKSG